MTEIDPALTRRIVWTMRVSARRDRSQPAGERRLSKLGLELWRQIAGRLHDGDLVMLLVENTAALSPLALRPFAGTIDAEQGRKLLHEALDSDPAILNTSSAMFLESAAVAFKKPPLSAERRSAFDAIRAQDQRILELPSTAGRVTAMVAPAGAQLETYVGYVVADDDDRFLVGLAMLEFERTALPTLVDVSDLESGQLTGVGSFSRAVTLGGEAEIIERFPTGLVQQVIEL